jgi:hypothetical protein
VPQLQENVVMPAEYWKPIKQITNISHEVRLVLFAKLQQVGDKKYHVVDFFQILAHGDAASVNNIPEARFRLAQEFLRARGSGVYHLDSHTHPFPPESYFASNFSQGDLDSFGRIIGRGQSDYKHVLFTRSHVVTFGPNPVSLQLAHENPLVMPKYERLKGEWDAIESGQ